MKNKELGIKTFSKIMPYSRLAMVIDKNTYNSIFKGNINHAINACLYRQLNEIYDDEVSKEIINNINLYYYCTKNGWKISIHPVDILNKILKICGINGRTKVFYNLEDENDYNTLKERFINIFNYYIEEYKDNPKVIDILTKSRDNIDKILSIDTFYVDKIIERILIPKNALFMLAYSFLVKLNETNNRIYAKLPIIYYSKFSKDSVYYWPKSVKIGKQRVWLKEFNQLYEDILKENPELFFPINKPVVEISEEIIKPGDDDIKVYEGNSTRIGYDKDKVKHYNEKDYNMLNRKLKLYSDDRIKYVVTGTKLLDGYIGFVCDNDTVIFDRLYRDSKESKPARDSAIYTVPSDCIEYIQRDKTELIDIIKKKLVPNLRRFYHSKNFEDKVMKVMQQESCSSKTFEEILEENRLSLTIKK